MGAAVRQHTVYADAWLPCGFAGWRTITLFRPTRAGAAEGATVRGGASGWTCH